MPRPRNKENAALPRRWRRYHGAFYYQVPLGEEPRWGGKRQFRLGSTLAEAAAEWSRRLEGLHAPSKTVGILLERYQHVVVPQYPPKTRSEKLRHIGSLMKVFRETPIAGFKPAYVYRYVAGRGKKIAAHREIETLSHAFTKLVEWGEIDRHPFKGEVRLEGETPRQRYVEDWELEEMLALPPRRKVGSVRMIQAYLRLKLLTGLARSDLLRLRAGQQLREDGIHVARHKTGKATIYEYAKVPERRAAVELAQAARPALSPFLFCNRRGEGYFDEHTGECHGWDSMWQRFVDRVLKETKVAARFTEHDLRAKVGSDAESLERARALLQHADARTTQRVYRRRPERV